MGECIKLMAEVFKALSRGEALNPLRRGMQLPDRSALLAMMPSYMAEISSMGVKVLGITSGAKAANMDSHIGAVLLFDSQDGRLKSIIDASSVTEIRTAAASGLATDLLARKDACDLAVLGSGVQARSHLSAMLSVRKIERIRVWSRNCDNAERFKEKESARHSINIERCASVEEAVNNADIICACTGAEEPILFGEMIAPGAHINAAGSSYPFARELDSAAVKRSALFTDLIESALNEAGDFLIPKKEGIIDDDHIRGEIGDVLLGNKAGRRSPDEVTLYKSLGIAVQDLGSADYIYNKATTAGIGTWIEFGGEKDID
jgi:ornithine cyclodeaminase